MPIPLNCGMLGIGVRMSAGTSLSEQPRSKLGILIVDDAEEVRYDLRTVLQLMPDLEVVGEAVDGIEAVALAEELRPDVVLMDLRMPGLDGLEATEQIRKRDLAKGIIMLTIYDQPENRARAASAGVDLFLEKGLGVEVLIAAIRHVGRSSLREAGSLPQHGG
jgi:DNA-binding NarL/FixJ family response regulator